MAASSCRMRRVAMFFRQVHALLLKNLSFQRRSAKANTAIAVFPALLCVLLVAIEGMVDHELDRPPFRCDCACVHRDGRLHGDGVRHATLHEHAAAQLRGAGTAEVAGTGAGVGQT
ncbi:hypothetical protein E2562_022039 [Oryza meyeriana var. granulata]|uniref:ABC-2 type transporter domain-containing protein n=1 Tax=Oryza meyeriana var. granulata TaxID=110450 RepID=A0A6G1ENL2_9ORYZ|nr:hypothetical protein E2562_022039 [Oryza meyeriana var. granulata]